MFEDCDGGGLFDKYMNSYVAVRAVHLDGTAGSLWGQGTALEN
jgi:hypothetical protein